jgi:hypothetical protein
MNKLQKCEPDSTLGSIKVQIQDNPVAEPLLPSFAILLYTNTSTILYEISNTQVLDMGYSPNTVGTVFGEGFGGIGNHLHQQPQGKTKSQSSCSQIVTRALLI